MHKALRTLLISIGIFAIAALAGCSKEETGPYLELRGGGFIFNYRIAEATMGLVAAPLRTLPAGGTIEASFEDPAGGPAIVRSEKIDTGKESYEFVTPPLKGIVADKEYEVVVRVLGADGKEVDRLEKGFHSQLDQSTLPEKPLVIGPVYTPNPELPPPGG